MYDVAVVGASLAGCTVAALLGRAGLSVALLEARRDPHAYQRVCTHHLQPGALPTLQRLGLGPLLEGAQAVRAGVEVWTRWGWVRPPERTGVGADGPGVNLRRARLDPALRALAAATPGVDLRCGHVARGLIEEGGRVSGVRVHSPAGALDLRATLTVGADGRHSRVAQRAGLRPRRRPNGRFCYFAYYRDLGLPVDRGQMWHLHPDVLYAFPNEDGHTLLACLLPNERLADFKCDLDASFREAFRDLPRGPDLGRGRRVSPILGMVELSNVSRAPVRRGLALAGDAAMTTDPMWGTGCGWALQSGEWLADAVVGALREGRGLDRALRRYARTHRRRLWPHHRVIASFSSGRPLNPVERLLFSAAVRDPVTARHVEAFCTRRIGPARLMIPGGLVRALRAHTGYALRGAVARSSAA